MDQNPSPPRLSADPEPPAPPADQDGDRYDCLVISDLHLGSAVCQAQLLDEFLEWAVDRTRVLVINGDIFDDLNFKRLTKRHFACLKIIRRNSDRPDLRLVWMRGNHDGPSEIVSHIVGVDILDEYVFQNAQVRLLILHGDQFDTIITRYKWLTAVFCWLFYWIQRGAPHRTARWIRRVSKRWQRNSQLIERGAVEYARSKGCQYVTCGHTHLAMTSVVDGVHYYNTGTWTEQPPCPFLSVRGGDVRLESWPRAEAEPPPATISDQELASLAPARDSIPRTPSEPNRSGPPSPGSPGRLVRPGGAAAGGGSGAGEARTASLDSDRLSEAPDDRLSAGAGPGLPH